MKYIAPLFILLAAGCLILQAFLRYPANDDWFWPLVQLVAGVILFALSAAWLVLSWYA